MLIVVSPFLKSFDDIGLTYFVPKELESYIKLGIVVDIPLQTQIVSGVVLDMINETSFDKDKIKPIVSIKYEEALLYDYQIKTIKWISNYYFCKIHSSLNLFFPRNLKEKIEKIKLDLSPKKKLDYIFNYKKTLTENQQNTINEIENTDKKIIFYGITGSGKTEVYINLVKNYLDKQKQSLILVPEIILNNQTYERFKEIFGDNVLMINSSITESKKTNSRIDIYNNNAKIIIGTRSSLFYPYKDLGLIIVDEEHDLSYKSESTPRIDTKEVVSFVANQKDIKTIFASGTPSIKTIFKGLKNEYKIINLLDEYKN
ncbi:MAG: DEAD/DEAH box helicase family protein [Candidatus Gracilibacteria bacterium]|nr:DEAD/DEAH box helicase family protein [Candidatus Gracilibacteria bacterium]